MKPSDSDGRYAILFVDDEAKARKYFGLAYAREFRVLTAEGVAEALEILEQQADEIGVLVTDQRMPGQQGVDLLKRAREDWPGIVRILTTAYSDLEDAIAAVNSGEIMRYITKPWNIDDLKLELRQAMEYFRLRRERDLLMEEKLSVRRSMVQSDLLRGMLAIAAGLRHLRHAPQAMASWTRDASDALKQEVAGIDALELWGLEVAQTLGLMAASRELQALDEAVEEGFPDEVALAELAGAAGISVSGPPARLSGSRPLLERLLARLAAVTGAPASAQCGPAVLEGDCPGMLLSIDGGGHLSRAYPPVVGEAESGAGILEASLIAWHHGGSLRALAADGGFRLELRLPEDPLAVTLPAPDADWLSLQFEALACP